MYQSTAFTQLALVVMLLPYLSVGVRNSKIYNNNNNNNNNNNVICN